jgi:sugar O-acyltransferase (sialic acid O-acetyltransferase NeuD family)
MLIIGAKGFAKEVLEICLEKEEDKSIAFYDDVNEDEQGLKYDKFRIIKTLEDAKKYFDIEDGRFTLGLGVPKLRFKLHQKFSKIGGTLTSTISQKAIIGHYNINIGKGCNILSGSTISNDVCIGQGCMLYYNSIITHDCKIGDFVEISPGVSILGKVIIGNYCQIGAGSTILPDVKIGNNVLIGAGATVTKDIPDNSLAVGIPAKVIKDLKPLQLWT